MNFAKFLRTRFLIEHVRWLLLNLLETFLNGFFLIHSVRGIKTISIFFFLNTHNNLLIKWSYC